MTFKLWVSFELRVTLKFWVTFELLVTFESWLAFELWVTFKYRWLLNYASFRSPWPSDLTEVIWQCLLWSISKNKGDVLSKIVRENELSSDATIFKLYGTKNMVLCQSICPFLCPEHSWILSIVFIKFMCLCVLQTPLSFIDWFTRSVIHRLWKYFQNTFTSKL